MRKYLLIALLPIVAYLWVIGGFSVGEDCVPTIWGNIPARIPNYIYCQQQADTGAYIWQHIPQWKEVARSYLSGQIPWWDSHAGLGAPLAANFISGAFNLPTVLANLDQTLLFGRWWMVIRLSIAAVGTYWLLNILGFPGWAGFAGVALFIFNGYITQLFSINHHDVDIYLPWVIGSIFLAQKKRVYWIVAGILLGLSLLAGMPESTIFVWTAALLTSLYLSRRLTGPGLMVLLGLAVSSILIIPGLEFVRQGVTSRTTGTNLTYYADQRNIVFWALPKIFGPFHNLLSKEQIFKILNLNYWGFASFLLILFSALKKRALSAWLLWGMIAVYFGILRIPWSIIPIWRDVIYVKYSLGLINLLAAIELARGITEWSKAGKNERWKIILLGWASITFLLILFSKDWWSVVGSGSGIKHLATVGFAIGQLCLALFLSWMLLRTKTVLGAAFFVVAELLLFLPWFGSRSWGYQIEKPEFVSWLMTHASTQDRIFGMNGQVYPNWAGLYGLNDIRYIGPLWPKNYVRYLKEFIQPDIDAAVMRFASTQDAAIQGQVRIRDNIFFDQLAAKYLISNVGESNPDWRLVYDGVVKIYENERALSRFRFVSKTICAGSDEEAVMLMNENEKLLRDRVIKIGTDCGDYSTGRILNLHETQNSVKINYELPQTGYLLVADNWYPGWQAFVNEKEITVDRVDLTMRGIELPAGKNTLVMNYLPSFFRAFQYIHLGLKFW